jgi:hypothetical protein
VTDEPIYGASAYALALCPIFGLMTIAACFSIRLTETLGPGRTPWPQQIS